MLWPFCMYNCRAESDKDEPSNTKSEVAQVNNDDLTKQVNKLLSILPKFSGYIQTGYNWGTRMGITDRHSN